MAPRRTDRAMGRLREIAREQSSTPPPACAAPSGYEHLAGVDWGELDPETRDRVCRLADALREAREHEIDILKLGTVDHVRALTAELRWQNAEMDAKLK